MPFKAVEFTKSNLTELRRDLDTLLSEYSKRSGVHFNVGNIRFDSNQATIKLSATLPSASGKTPEEEAFDMFAKLDHIALKLGEAGSTRQLGDVKFVGYKSRNRKYPYIVEQIKTGSRYKMSTDQARRVCPNKVGAWPRKVGE